LAECRWDVILTEKDAFILVNLYSGGKALMMFKRMVLILTAALMLAGIAGCSKEGPAEKAGKKLDEAAQKAKKMFD
jgi:predicted small lipoprotein YifL